jgi:hypothetical protein
MAALAVERMVRDLVPRRSQKGSSPTARRELRWQRARPASWRRRMWIRMTVCARTIAEPVENDVGIISQRRIGMTGSARDFAMAAVDGITGHILVREVIDLERRGTVTLIARAHRRAVAELSRVDVVVASLAGVSDAAIARASTGASICFAWRMTTVAGGLGVRASERPDRVIDVGTIPSERRVAMGAASITHLSRELIAVWVGMAVHAQTIVYVQVEARVRIAVATTTARCLVATLQREASLAVHLHGERRGTKALLVVAACAFASLTFGELSAVNILVATIAAIELQASITAILDKARFMAARTRYFFVLAAKWEYRIRVRAQCDRARHAEPADARVAGDAVRAESRLMHRSMAVDTGRALRGCNRRAPIVASVAGDVGVARGEAQARVAVAGHCDFGPAVFAVATRARIAQVPLMRVCVTARARLKLDPTIARRRSVTLGALHTRMCAVKRKTRLIVIQMRQAHLTPVLLVVTALAGAAETVLVRIFVAGHARCLQS